MSTYKITFMYNNATIKVEETRTGKLGEIIESLIQKYCIDETMPFVFVCEKIGEE